MPLLWGGQSMVAHHFQYGPENKALTCPWSIRYRRWRAPALPDAWDARQERYYLCCKSKRMKASEMGICRNLLPKFYQSPTRAKKIDPCKLECMLYLSWMSGNITAMKRIKTWIYAGAHAVSRILAGTAGRSTSKAPVRANDLEK